MPTESQDKRKPTSTERKRSPWDDDIVTLRSYLTRVVARKVGGDEREDVVQETLLKLLNELRPDAEAARRALAGRKLDDVLSTKRRRAKRRALKDETIAGEVHGDPIAGSWPAHQVAGGREARRKRGFKIDPKTGWWTPTDPNYWATEPDAPVDVGAGLTWVISQVAAFIRPYFEGLEHATSQGARYRIPGGAAMTFVKLYESAYGHSPLDHDWIRWAFNIEWSLSTVHVEAPSRRGGPSSMCRRFRSLFAEQCGHLVPWPEWLTDDVIVRLYELTDIGRGGGRGRKGSRSINAAVNELVNRERRREKLKPLAATAHAFRPGANSRRER